MDKKLKVLKNDAKDLNLTINPLNIDKARKLICHCKCYSCKGAHP